MSRNLHENNESNKSNNNNNNNKTFGKHFINHQQPIRGAGTDRAVLYVCVCWVLERYSAQPGCALQARPSNHYLSVLLRSKPGHS